MMKPELENIRGIGPAKLRILNDNQVMTVEALLAKPFAQITRLSGFTPTLARQIRANARMIWNRWLSKQADESLEQSAPAPAIEPTPIILDAFWPETLVSPDSDKPKKKKKQKGDKGKKGDKKVKTKNKSKSGTKGEKQKKPDKDKQQNKADKDKQQKKADKEKQPKKADKDKQPKKADKDKEQKKPGKDKKRKKS